jgi:hypothetical protein
MLAIIRGDSFGLNCKEKEERVMSGDNSWTADIVSLGNTLIKEIIDDEIAAKSIDVVCKYAEKEGSSVEDVATLLEKVDEGYGRRMEIKKEMVNNLAGYCKQLGLAKFVEAFIPFLKEEFEKHNKGKGEVTHASGAHK